MSVVNPYATPQQVRDTGSLTADDLQLPTGHQRFMVVENLRSIPLSELYPMCPNVLVFGIAVVLYKTLRLSNANDWAIALEDVREIRWDELPPHWRAEYERRRAEAESLGFIEPHLLTAPSIGPQMAVELIMSQRDGKIQISFQKECSRSSNATVHQWSLSMFSRLAGGEVLLTRRRRPALRRSDWQKIKAIRTNKAKKLFEIHQTRLAQEAVRPISLEDAVAVSIAEDRRVITDILRRGIVRDATAAEVFRITQNFPETLAAS